MHQNPFVSLLIITALAAVVPILAKRFRLIQLPIVVGEILAGIVIGRSGLNLIEPSETLTFLAEFGFTYLMFLSGLEVDFDLLLGARDAEDTPLWESPIFSAVLVFLLTLLLGLGSAVGLQRLGMVENPLLMGLILSTTSLGIVVPVLKERNLLGTAYGQALLLAALLADFVTLFLLTIVIAAMTRGLTPNLLLIVVLLIAFAFVARVARTLVRIPAWQRMVEELSVATAQIRVRGAFALMVAWVVLAEALGVEVILGAFLAGALVGLLAGREEEAALHDKLDAIGYGFFVPIFFINVGLNFNLQALISSPRTLLLVLLLVILAYLVKLVPALTYRARFPWRETLAGGFLLSSRLSLIIAASAIALSVGAISEVVNSAIILVAVVTCTLSPFLFNRLFPMQVETEREGVIIVGTDQMAELLARRLKRLGERVTITGTDPRRLDILARMGYHVVKGLPSEPRVLDAAGASRAAALISVTANTAVREAACVLARERFGIPVIVARVGSLTSAERLRRLGVRTVQPGLATVIALEGALRFPTAFDILAHHDDEDVDVGEVVVKNRRMTGIPLRRLHLPGNALILSIRRDQAIIVPHGDVALQPGDRVAVIGSRESVTETIQILGEPRSRP